MYNSFVFRNVVNTSRPSSTLSFLPLSLSKCKKRLNLIFGTTSPDSWHTSRGDIISGRSNFASGLILR